MSKTEIDELRAKIASFGKELSQKRAEVEKDGRFKDVYEAQWNRIEAAHSHLYGRVNSDFEGTGVWSLLKAELVRDFEAMSEQMSRMTDRLDASAIKNEKPK